MVREQRGKFEAAKAVFEVSVPKALRLPQKHGPAARYGYLQRSDFHALRHGVGVVRHWAASRCIGLDRLVGALSRPDGTRVWRLDDAPKSPIEPAGTAVFLRLYSKHGQTEQTQKHRRYVY